MKENKIFKRLVIFAIATTMCMAGFAVLPTASAASTYYVDPSGSDTTGDGSSGNPWLTIQYAINQVLDSDTINVAAGTYTETLDLKGKELTIDGAGVGNTIIDASSLSGYAISNFGDHTTIRDLTLIGTPDNYGFKVSHVSDVTLENIRVEDSKKTGVDLHTIDGATLSNIEVVDTVSGFGIMILDSNDVGVTDIMTDNNPWGGVSVQTVNTVSDSISFSGTFDAREYAPLLFEKNPPTYYDITNYNIPSKFDYVVYDFRVGDDYMQWYYQETLSDAKTFANALLSSPYTYSGMLIYDILKENYYVIPGMLIQDAVDDATSTSTTIHVDAGTYTNDLEDTSLPIPQRYRITKSITLLGAQAGNDPAGSIDRGGESILVRTDGLPYSLYAPDITIDGFMIGSSAPNTGCRLIISDVATDTTITNCIIKNTPSSSSGHGVYIYPGGTGATISHNTFYNTAWEAIAGSSVSDAEISYNHISASGQNAIQLMGHAGSNNIITHNHFSSISSKNAIQYWGGSNLEVSHNIIEGENTMYDGVWLDNAADNSIVTNNVISDTIYAGINIRGDCINVDVMYNDISGCGTGIEKHAGDVTGVIITCNNIYGNGMGVVNYNSVSIDATCNWWSGCSGPSGEGTGTGDSVSTNVDFDPWIGKVVANAGGPYSIVNNLTVHFDGSGSFTPGCCGEIVTYEWDFGDGDTSTEQSPTHTYDNGGGYTVNLTVSTEALGHTCSDTDTTIVTIDDTDVPTVQLKYPTGSEILKDTISIEWYAHDFIDGYNLPIYLYLSDDNGESWSPFADNPLENTGEYRWDTTKLPDGTYELIAEALDDEDNIGHDSSEPFEIDNHYDPENEPPNKPNKPSGPTSGKAGEEYAYSTSSTDPNGDQVWYKWDWGDGADSDWIGPYDSGDTATASHVWDEKGDYSIKVKAKDVHGEESPWSDPLAISMPKSKAINPFLLFLERLIERFPILEQILQPIYDELAGF